MNRLAVRTVRILAAVLVVAVCGFAGDSMIGTWKLDTAKSKYTGVPMPREMTVTYAAHGDGYMYSARGTSSDGKPMGSSWMYMKDGEDIAMTGFPYADTLVLKNGKADVATAVFKRAGRQVGTARRTIAKGARSMTIHADLTLPDGRKASYDAVYAKQ